jgi:hypothetical protein
MRKEKRKLGVMLGERFFCCLNVVEFNTALNGSLCVCVWLKVFGI